MTYLIILLVAGAVIIAAVLVIGLCNVGGVDWHIDESVRKGVEDA